MKLIKNNILATVVDQKEGSVVKKGSLFVPIKSDTVRSTRVKVDLVDDNIKDIKKGDILEIHKEVGHYLSKDQLIFNKREIIYAD